MKENKELVHIEEKNKLTKFNYVVMIILIGSILLLVGVIAWFVFVHNSESSKLERYLKDEGYECNNDTCSKVNNNDVYLIEYKNDIMMVDNSEYQVRVGKITPMLDLKKQNLVCSYMKEDYSSGMKIDETFVYNSDCQNNMKLVNKYIEEYQTIKKKALGNN